MDENKVLIIGGDSNISRNLIKQFQINNISYIATTRKKNNLSQKLIYLDLEDEKTFSNLENLKINNVILLAAICNINYCENNQIITRKINVDNSFILLNYLNNIYKNLKIIYISTDLVFDGSNKKSFPYDHKLPLTEYGRQKSDLEDKLQISFNNIKIIRFSKIIHENFELFKSWKNDLNQNKRIYAYTDLYFSPISIDYAIKAILYVLKRKIILNEIFHVSSSKKITYYDAALYFSKILKKDLSLVKPIRINLNNQDKRISKDMLLGGNIKIKALHGINIMEMFV